MVGGGAGFDAYLLELEPSRRWCYEYLHPVGVFAKFQADKVDEATVIFCVILQGSLN